MLTRNRWIPCINNSRIQPSRDRLETLISFSGRVLQLWNAFWTLPSTLQREKVDYAYIALAAGTEAFF